MRRFDPDIVQNGHIYSSMKEAEEFINYIRPTSTSSVCYADDFVGGVDNHLQLDNQSEKHSVWHVHVTTSMR